MERLEGSRVFFQKDNQLYRRCAKCQKIKLAEAFYKNPGMPGGIGGYCKSCASKYQEIWRKNKNYISSKEYYQEWYQSNKKTLQAERRKKRESNQMLKILQDRAWYEFDKALSKGLVKGPPLLCQSCRDIDKIGAQYEAHHPNYSEPLRVLWLCKSCHRREHRNGLPQLKGNP